MAGTVVYTAMFDCIRTWAPLVEGQRGPLRLINGDAGEVCAAVLGSRSFVPLSSHGEGLQHQPRRGCDWAFVRHHAYGGHQKNSAEQNDKREHTGACGRRKSNTPPETAMVAPTTTILRLVASVLCARSAHWASLWHSVRAKDARPQSVLR
jgi:hypothetical protein